MAGTLKTLKKAAPVIAVTWVLCLITTLILICLVPNVLLINTKHISDGAVTGDKIADNAIIAYKLSDGSVTSAKIADGTITAVDISDGSIITAKIVDGAITSTKLAEKSVTSGTINDGAIINAKLDDGSVTTAKIANATITAFDIANDTILSINIADGAITASEIADGAVTTTKIADRAVVTSNLADGSVTAEKLDYGLLTSSSSVILWRDGEFYFGRDGSTGAIEFFGTDATDVINHAIESLPSGGMVFFREAIYDIDGTIEVVDKVNVNLVGESDGTLINLKQNSNVDMVHVTNASYTTIRSLYFQGNRDLQSRGMGLVVYHSNRILVERCFFYEIKQTAIYLYADPFKLCLQPWITQNYIEKVGTNSSDHGICLGEGTFDAHISNNDVGRATGSALFIGASGSVVSTNTFWGSLYGINAYMISSANIGGNIVDGNLLDGINVDSCQNLLIFGNTAKLNSNATMNMSSGIHIFNSNYTGVVSNRAGVVGDYRNESQRYGIKEDGPYSDHNQISCNHVYGNMGTQDIYSVGPNTIVSDNLGRYTPKNND
jgi:hypothetical protein